MIKEYKKELCEFVLTIISLLIMFDILGFMWWATSGQIPTDNYYLGVITKTIISLFI